MRAERRTRKIQRVKAVQDTNLQRNIAMGESRERREEKGLITTRLAVNQEEKLCGTGQEMRDYKTESITLCMELEKITTTRYEFTGKRIS